MKTTITVPIITSQEVEVSLPQFRMINCLSGTDYIAYYGEKDDDNLYFRVKHGKLQCYMAWANINKVQEGTPISQSEFIKAFDKAKDNIDLFGTTPTITNDEQGEYYIEQTQLLNSHE